MQHDIVTHPLLDGRVFVLHFSLLHGRINHQLIQLKVSSFRPEKRKHQQQIQYISQKKW